MDSCSTLNLIVVSPEKTLYDGDVEKVTLPGTLGSFTVLPRHAPLISSLEKGQIVYLLNEENKEAIDIESGFVEIKDNVVTVCVEQ